VRPAASPLPEALLRSLEGLPGYDRAAFEAVHAEGEARTSLRLNPGKWKDRGMLNLADALPSPMGQGVATTPVPWWEGGCRVQPRPSFAFDPLWHAGAYYVQEASSMFLGHAVRELMGDRRALRVLDLCAAPGGKSTQLATLPHTGLLLSNETIRTRVPVLHENLVKWGSPRTFISNEDPSALARMEGFFDLMIVDAPCSGSGLFRRDPAAIEEWSPAHVELCSRRQRRILAEALPALAPGGVLVYSTCSYSREEDEDILDWLVREQGLEGLRIRIHEEWGVVESVTPTGAVGYRFYPDRLAGEGFFLACLRKGEGASATAMSARPPRSVAWKGSDLADWISDPEALHFSERDGNLIAVPMDLAGDVATIAGLVRLRKSGVMAGRLLRGNLLPDHELAMSTLLHPGRPILPLSREDALRYLRKEAVPPDGQTQGWALASWMGLPLGWLKCMPGRSNNHYPSEWRIRSAGPPAARKDARGDGPG
jgi:16S rRNA C967 or C1407 C5-methylase (RsmB/RsmF family)/NOL1/NOP2/fmu family ribosome biogenesis protein